MPFLTETTSLIFWLPRDISASVRIYEASSKNLYAVYKQWCDDNALNSLSQKSFGSFLKQNESRYNLEYTNKVNIGGGRFARGFVGIELLQRPFL